MWETKITKMSTELETTLRNNKAAAIKQADETAAKEKTQKQQVIIQQEELKQQEQSQQVQQTQTAEQITEDAKAIKDIQYEQAAKIKALRKTF